MIENAPVWKRPISKSVPEAQEDWGWEGSDNTAK
jgi:hypothetical protein